LKLRPKADNFRYYRSEIQPLPSGATPLTSRGGTMDSRIGSFAIIAVALLAACESRSPGEAQAQTPATPAAAAAADGPVAPRFEIDPFWPKPLPNNWLLGSVIGISVDSRDHVWIIHRRQSLNAQTEIPAGTNTPQGACCSAAPP